MRYTPSIFGMLENDAVFYDFLYNLLNINNKFSPTLTCHKVCDNVNVAKKYGCKTIFVNNYMHLTLDQRNRG